MYRKSISLTVSSDESGDEETVITENETGKLAMPSRTATVKPLLGQDGYGVTKEQLIKITDERGGQNGKKYIEENFKSIKRLCKLLKTDPVQGLPGAPSDLQRRTEFFGRNEIPLKPPKSFLRLMWEAMQDTTLIILQIAAIISLALSFYQPNQGDEHSEEEPPGWIEGAAILVSVFIVIFVTAFNDYSKERQFRGLQNKIASSHYFTVIRLGVPAQISVSDIVVGDICQIKYGDTVPADGVVLQSNDLRVDENSLTGENNYVLKAHNEDLVVMSGTNVMDGSAKFLVTAVGLSSVSGQIMGLLGASAGSEADVASKSVLQRKLSRLTIQIGYIGSFIALLTVIILIVRFSLEQYLFEGRPFSVAHINYFVRFFIIGVTVLVVAVPEGLPLAVTISLAYSVKKMMSDNNLVRHLDACETMGNATTICSDKTGTLTTNRMTVVRAHIADTTYSSIPIDKGPPDDLKELLSVAISVNSNYSSRIIPSETQGALPVQLGNKTECALLDFLWKLGWSYKEIRKTYPEESFTKVFTFNSARKSMTTIVPLEGEGFKVYTKGASEIILDRCDFYHHGNDNIEPFTDVDKQNIEKDVINLMAHEGLRTIAVAYRDIVPFTSHPSQKKLSEVPTWDDDEELTKGSVLLAILGVEDPVRPEVPKAIETCQNAGIIVRMITGDNINTARSIARKCGILTSASMGLVLDSKEFNKRIKDEKGIVQQHLLNNVWPHLRVLARSTPQDKHTLVKGIKEAKTSSRWEVVAVTGDGTNDGPALKIADVGFAMGITGTDVAKEACDIVLLDDNFKSIVAAVMWGRNVYDSIAKFLQFQLTVNVVAVTVAFVSVCVISDTPLKAVQMLWVNLIMDTFASLALATEPPTKSLLKRKPYGRNKALISSQMAKNIVGQAVYMIFIIFLLLFYGYLLVDIESGLYAKHGSQPSEHFTMIFNAFVLMTLFNEFNARKLNGELNVFRGLFSNPLFCIIWLFTLVLQVLIIEFGGYAFHTASLNLDQWCWCFFFGIGTLLWGQFLSSSNLLLKLLFSNFESSRTLKRLSVQAPIEKDDLALMLNNMGGLPIAVSKNQTWNRKSFNNSNFIKVKEATN